MREIINKLFVVIIICFWIVACSPKHLPPHRGFAYYEIRTICSSQKEFHDKNGRYATLAELRETGLVTGDRRNNDDIDDGEVKGYKFQVQITSTGYFAKAIPLDYGTKDSVAPAFYVDEKRKIRISFNGIEARSDSPEYIPDKDSSDICCCD